MSQCFKTHLKSSAPRKPFALYGWNLSNLSTLRSSSFSFLLRSEQFSVHFVLKTRQDPQTEVAVLEADAHQAGLLWSHTARSSWTPLCRTIAGMMVLYLRNSSAVPPVPASLIRQQLAGSEVPVCWWVSACLGTGWCHGRDCCWCPTPAFHKAWPLIWVCLFIWMPFFFLSFFFSP